MARVLVIPAAGAGSRLQTAGPKALVEIGGITMLDRLLALYDEAIDGVVVVVHPTFFAAASADRFPPHVEFAIQERPTGMLDAILLGADAVRRAAASSIWITWCDQVAVHPRTVARLAAVSADRPDAALILPTVRRRDPYIHFERDDSGRITRVLHRREGDAMPERGESDMGLFALSAEAFALLDQYASEVRTGRTTGERNFLPFIPWVAARRPILTFPCEDPMEAVGVNTPAERQQVERYLAQRQG